VNFFYQGSFHTYGVIITRRCFTGHTHVVDNVNASDKGNLLVHNHHFPVQATQPLSLKRPGRYLGPELQHHYAGPLKEFDHGFGQTIGAESIDQNVGFHPTEGRPSERFRDALSRIVIFENIAFQINFMNRLIQGRFHGREIGLTGLQQGNLII
jgi:hypothetical protein